MKKVLLFAALIAAAFSAQAETTVITLENADGKNVVVSQLTQGATYSITGADEFATDSWYYDPDFFQKNTDGTYTFLPLSGTYTIKADFTKGGFKVWGMNDATNTGTLNADGTGYLWVIGDACYGKPTINTEGWWTDTDHALCLAPIKEKVHQITFIAGKQIKVEGVNFKFFGQAGWGTEFKGTASTHTLSTESEIFTVGTDSSIDGNIVYREGKTMKDSMAYIFTVDLTEGTSKGVLTVTEKDITSGVSRVLTNGNSLSVVGLNGAVRVATNGATSVSVYNTSGALVATATVDGAATIGGLAPGIYIVNHQKVIVK